MKYLKMRGFKIGLASSTREVLVRSEISDGGLLGYFDQIVGGDMVERSKPEPDIFLEACRRLGTRPEKRFWDRFAQCRNFCRGQAYKFICFYECQ